MRSGLVISCSLVVSSALALSCGGTVNGGSSRQRATPGADSGAGGNASGVVTSAAGSTNGGAQTGFGGTSYGGEGGGTVVGGAASTGGGMTMRPWDAGSGTGTSDGAAPPQPTDAVRAADGRCVPFATVANEPWLPGIDYSQYGFAEGALAATKQMFGKWTGVAIADPGWAPPAWTVTIEFRSDATYSASGFVGSAPTPAFYYGSDEACSLKHWEIWSLTSAGLGGDIDVTFMYPSEKCYLPAWQGNFTDLHFDATSERMRFDFRAGDDVYPVHYDLRRVCDGG